MGENKRFLVFPQLQLTLLKFRFFVVLEISVHSFPKQRKNGSGYLVNDRLKLYIIMNHFVIRSCQRSRFENDKVLRTYRATRCRSVLFHRSRGAVSPVSLPTHRWVSTGKTAAYACQKSLKPRPPDTCAESDARGGDRFVHGDRQSPRR